jgi:2-methylcitrate dehydratase
VPRTDIAVLLSGGQIAYRFDPDPLDPLALLGESSTGVIIMKFPRRQILHLAAGVTVLPIASRIARAEDRATSPILEPRDSPLAERLATYADRLRYDDLDDATIERVKVHLIDSLGCGIAAFDEKPVRICRDVVLASGGDGATVIGTRRRAAPDLATFANCAALRYFDLNDAYVGRITGHPSDNIAACLAVAEAERAGAAELITAIALAYEINCRLIDAFGVNIGARGWDVPVLSLPAVALAAGKLMKLSPDKLTQAVSLALNDHISMGQTRVQAVSDWKGIADAEAGRNGVFAAMLARAGLTGPAPIFEGRFGFFELVAGPADVDVGSFGRRGLPFRINQCGLKAYPAHTTAQTTVVAGIALAKEIGNLDRIAAIEIGTTHRGYQIAGSDPEKWAPDTKETADHSLPYIAARAMFDAGLDNDSYTPEKLHDPRILAFMRKITVKEDPDFATLTLNVPPTRLTATLDDGRRLTRLVDSMPGFPGQPISRADVERKFRSNVAKRWPQERTDAVLQALWMLDRMDNLPSLLSQLTLQT